MSCFPVANRASITSRATSASNSQYISGGIIPCRGSLTARAFSNGNLDHGVAFDTSNSDEDGRLTKQAERMWLKDWFEKRLPFPAIIISYNHKSLFRGHRGQVLPFYIGIQAFTNAFDSFRRFLCNLNL